MEFQWEEIGVHKKKLSVTISAEDVQAKVDEGLAVARKQAKFKGFRPGKAPMAMVKKAYGPQVEHQVSEELVNEALPKALEEKGLDLAGPPSLDESSFELGKPFTFAMSFEVKPVFELSGYEGLELTREPVNVTEEMVDERLNQILEGYAATVDLEEPRPIEKGDIAVIDYKAMIGGEPVEGGANPNFQLEVGAGYFNEDFEAQLIGAAKDEEKQIAVEFEETFYNPRLAGQKVEFTVKVLDIKLKKLPELNDEFVAQLGQERLKTVDDLKLYVKGELARMEHQRVTEMLNASLHDKLCELTEFDAPEGMIEREIESMIYGTKMNLQRSGLSLEAAGLSEDKMRADYHDQAVKNVKVGLIMGKIAEENDIQVSENEINTRIYMMALQSGQQPDKVFEMYNTPQMIAGLTESILAEKTMKFLLEKANIEGGEGDEAPQGVDEPVEAP